MTFNEAGIASMRSDFPADVARYFDAFVEGAKKFDWSTGDGMHKTTRISGDSDDHRVLRMHAYRMDDRVGIHAELFLRGTYGMIYLP